MPKVDGSLGSLVQGVSQQPTRNRREGQAEEQFNIVNDEVFGLSRRGGAQLQATIDRPFALTDTLEYGNFRDNKGDIVDYIAKTGVDAALKFYRNGVEKSITYTDAAAEYIKGTVDKVIGKKIITSTIGNDTKLLNVEKIVKKADDRAIRFTTTAIVWLSGVTYGTLYSIKITDNTGRDLIVSYRTFDGSSATHSKYTKTTPIINTLFELILGRTITSDGVNKSVTKDTNGNNASSLSNSSPNKAFISGITGVPIGINVVLRGDYLFLSSTGVQYNNFTVTVSDSSGKELINVLEDTVTDATKLPNRAAIGQISTILGSSLEEDNYYLKWAGTDINGDGPWVETTAPGEKFKLDATTLPHIIKRDGDNYTIEKDIWTDRKAGDDLTNSFPAFTEDVITDIIEFQGRALYVYPSGIVLSVTNEYNNLFSQTATAILVTDPVGVTATNASGENTALRYAVPYSRDVIVFGTNNIQFVLDGRIAIGPETVTFVPSTAFDIDLNTRPITSDNNILVNSFSGQFNKSGEIFVSGNNGEQDIRILSNHVPRYMVGEPVIFVNDAASNISMFVNDNREEVSIYEYLWIDNQRVLSAWSKWTFNKPVVKIRITDGVVHVWTYNNNGSLQILVIGLDTANTGELDFRIHLDFLQVLPSAGTSITDVRIASSDTPRVLRVSDGVELGVDRVDKINNTSDGTYPNRTITLKKPYTGDVYVGISFETTYVPTMPIMRDQDGAAITGAKLSVSDFTITYEQSNEFVMKRKSFFEEPEDYWTYKYSGVTLGDPTYTITDFKMHSGKIDFPFDDQNNTSDLVIWCNSPYPMVITEIEWRGSASYRSRRITDRT